MRKTISGANDKARSVAPAAARLARGLKALKEYQESSSTPGIVTSDALSRTDRESLINGGYLKEILAGWYLVSRPGVGNGDSAAWYPNFWDFASAYMGSRFGSDYCLSAEGSIGLHAGDTMVPKQAVFMVQKGSAFQNINLLQGTSLMIYTENRIFPSETVRMSGINAMSMAEAISRLTETYVQNNQANIATVLRAVDRTALSRRLIEGGHSTVAGWVCGAWNELGFRDDAEELLKIMRMAQHQVNVRNPFSSEFKAPKESRARSPSALRIESLWAQMRGEVEKAYGEAPKTAHEKSAFLKQSQDIFVHDAYHSLSIEGFKVSDALISKVANGNWNPEADEQDAATVNALAARGYRNAFDGVMNSIGKILDGGDLEAILRKDHRDWFTRMFQPHVQAGVLQAVDLMGYRRSNVFISNSRHVPPAADQVGECMDTLFTLIANEPHPGVRATLGHLFYECIHPYMDGNGRTGRFLMNALFAAGGYPWTIVPVERRDDYIGAMVKGSESRDAAPLAQFLIEEMQKTPDYLNRKTHSGVRKYSRP